MLFLQALYLVPLFHSSSLLLLLVPRLPLVAEQSFKVVIFDVPNFLWRHITIFVAVDFLKILPEKETAEQQMNNNKKQKLERTEAK